MTSSNSGEAKNQTESRSRKERCNMCKDLGAEKVRVLSSKCPALGSVITFWHLNSCRAIIFKSHDHQDPHSDHPDDNIRR
jgi:hypothetical protein